MELIDKAAVVAEIERRATFFLNESKKKTTSDDSSCAVALYGLLSFLDTLEVKEVDLEHEIEKVKKMQRNFEIKNDTIIEFCAKHFFELGLKAKGE